MRYCGVKALFCRSVSSLYTKTRHF
uniref:Uncharacterized protein n=1 Tax=Anguilla anguilla TaxID=7936 RepID=A0A0E9T9U2_ANGAN